MPLITSLVSNKIVGLRAKSLTVPTYTIVPASTVVREGTSLQINVLTTNVPDGTVLHWRISLTGNDVVNDWVENVTAFSQTPRGSFVITGGVGSFTVNPVKDSLVEDDETFGVIIGSTSNFFRALAGFYELKIKNQYFYALTNSGSTDPTSSIWRTTRAPEGYRYVPNEGIYSDNPIVNMDLMFSGNSAFNDPGVSLWDTSTVTNMESMFYGASAFNQNIGSWNTRNVTNMAYMFYNASSFNRYIGLWNVSAVTDMNHMFSGASNFNTDLSGWCVTNIQNVPNMFSSNLNSLLHPVWGTCPIAPKYPVVPASAEVIKLSWNNGQISSTNLSPTSYTISTANHHNVYSVVSTTSPFGTTNNVLRRTPGSSMQPQAIMNIDSSFSQAVSNSIFTGASSWSVEWWGRFTWDGSGFDAITILGQSFDIGFDIDVSISSATTINIGAGINNGTGGGFGQGYGQQNIPYNSGTWAHFVVAWEALSANEGHFNIWINGVRVHRALRQKNGLDFFRTANRQTMLFTTKFPSQQLLTEIDDFRILNRADVWTVSGDRFLLPTSSFQR
jgi:surface protein